MKEKIVAIIVPQTSVESMASYKEFYLKYGHVIENMPSSVVDGKVVFGNPDAHLEKKVEEEETIGEITFTKVYGPPTMTAAFIYWYKGAVCGIDSYLPFYKDHIDQVESMHVSSVKGITVFSKDKHLGAEHRPENLQKLMGHCSLQRKDYGPFFVITAWE